MEYRQRKMEADCINEAKDVRGYREGYKYKEPHRTNRRRQAGGGKKQILLRAALLCFLAAGGLFTATAVSSAYWTDRIETKAELGALDIGIEYEDNDLQIENADRFMPGDSSPFSFTVNNHGKVSADIKPVITIKTSEDMKKGLSEYLLTLEDGSDAGALFDAVYLKGETEVDPEQDGFDTVRYTAKQFTTLAGSEQKDAELDADQNQGRLLEKETYKLRLKLHELAENRFMGVAANLGVNTYAIQHRHTEGIREDDGWMQATPAKAER